MFFGFPMANRDLQIKESVKSLKRKLHAEKDANVRDRLRVIVLVAKGLTDSEIGDKLGYSIQWVKKWIGRYKKRGLAGLQDGQGRGATPFLSDEQVLVLYDEILAGPDPSGALSRYRISDIQALIKDRFSVEFSLSGTHALMQRMMLSRIKPRPSHPNNDPQVMEGWKKSPKNP